MGFASMFLVSSPGILRTGAALRGQRSASAEAADNAEHADGEEEGNAMEE